MNRKDFLVTTSVMLGILYLPKKSKRQLFEEEYKKYEPKYSRPYLISILVAAGLEDKILVTYDDVETYNKRTDEELTKWRNGEGAYYACSAEAEVLGEYLDSKYPDREWGVGRTDEEIKEFWEGPCSDALLSKYY